MKDKTYSNMTSKELLELKEETLKKKKEKLNKVQSEIHRTRYKNDPEFKEIKNKANKNYKRNNPKGSLLTMAKSRAKKLKIEFSITQEDFEIPTHCPVLGIELIPLGTGTKAPAPNSPSLDRIDNNQGYIPGNVKVISFKANSLKRDASLEDIRMLLNYMENNRII